MFYDFGKIDRDRFLEDLLNLQNSPRYKSTTTNQRNDYQKEISDLNKKIALEPDNFECIEKRGDLYLELGQPFEAVFDYLTANELGPGYDNDINIARCFFARGKIWERVNYLEDAWQDYDMAFGFDISNSQYEANRDRLKIKLNKTDELWN
jgi:tetratricopeptide (TPR) repeat protein